LADRTWEPRPGKLSSICGTLSRRAAGEFFSGDATPASTWVGVAALADPGFLIEIEAIAVID